jgi:hypothetical protein
VKIYRSAERRLGDFTTVGEKVFDGYGSTNTLELRRSMQPATNSDPAKPSLFLNGPPPELQTNATIAPPLNDCALAAPTNLRGWWCRVFEGTPHFVDTPPQRNAAFTYTIYACDRMGQVAYPVVVTGALDSSANPPTFAERSLTERPLKIRLPIPAQNGSHP